MYDVQVLAETFRSIVCYLLLALLLVSVAAIAITWLAKTMAEPMRRLLGGGIVRIALATAMVGTGIVESFSKHTNAPPRSVPSPLPAVTLEDISNGWRVVATRDDQTLSRPSDSLLTIHEPWLVRGGFGDVARIPVAGWSFPWRDGFADDLIVFSDGDIRLDLRTSYFPRPLGVSLAVVPAFNWPLLPGGVSNVFWHAATPSNSLVIAWENAPVNCDASGLTNFQAEFFSDGRFLYRHPDREVEYAPVFPFDWDADGLENSVDPDPLVAGPDAHGTNAEWYNTVCSNVFSAVECGGNGTMGIPSAGDGGILSWREGVNSNAYYFVDVVTTNGPAPICFTGDRESRLGNPIVVARAWETNRVPLLLGIAYAVTSTVPFTVSFPTDYMYPVVETNMPCVAHIRWPLEFQFIESLTPSNRAYAVSVEPYDPGGTFSWEANGAGTSLGGQRGGGCNCISYAGRTIVFGCSAECTCSADCVAAGTYYLESATFPFTGGECRCGFSDPPPDTPTTYDMTNAPSFSISFSKPAVIFEEAYQDSDGRSVPKRSTRVRLTVRAYGGPHGGAFLLASQNLGKLAAVAGGDGSIPAAQNLAAGESFYMTCIYEAATLSGGADDIVVTGYFIENETGNFINANDTLTSIQLLVSPERPFPSGYPDRHTFGVCEKMGITPYPTGISGFSWAISDSDMVSRLQSNTGAQMFEFQLDEGACAITFTYGSVSYVVHVMCLRPHDIVCRKKPEILLYGLSQGHAGGIGMLMELTLMPDTVWFEGVRVMERVANGVPTGYFLLDYFRPWWIHGTEQGAQNPSVVGTGNNFGDTAATEDECPEYTTGGWSVGTITWPIPVAWRERSDFPRTKGWLDFVVKEQKVTIDAVGTVGEEKFGWRVERDVQGHTNVNLQAQGGNGL